MYHGDKVESLIVFLQDENNPLKEKNMSIWALGELKDERVLQVLKELHISEECNHSKYVCQYEVDKAIKMIECTYTPDLSILVRQI